MAVVYEDIAADGLTAWVPVAAGDMVYIDFVDDNNDSVDFDGAQASLMQSPDEKMQTRGTDGNGDIPPQGSGFNRKADAAGFVAAYVTGYKSGKCRIAVASE